MKFADEYPEADGLKAADILEGHHRRKDRLIALNDDSTIDGTIFMKVDCADQPCRGCGTLTPFMAIRGRAFTRDTGEEELQPIAGPCCSDECLVIARQSFNPDAYV